MGMPAAKLPWDDNGPKPPTWLQELYPTPWRAVVHAGLNRSSIIAANGTHFISGMNNEKAALIVIAVNALASR